MAGKRHRLVSTRKEGGFSQERLAEVVGVERSTIMCWERGETTPQPWARPKLARALGISDQALSELLGEVAEPEGAASASGSIAGEAASPYRRDFPNHSVVFPALEFDELRHLGAPFDDAGYCVDVEGVPSGWASAVLCDALSRRLGRTVTLNELGLAVQLLSAPAALDWRADTLIALADLGKVDVDVERRRVLAAAAYSVAALAVLDESWWRQMAARGTARAIASARGVGRGDLEAVREMASLFSRVDQRRGGGHARSTLVQYLTSDVATYLRGSYADERVRKDMFSAASELAYLSGWMAFDNAEQTIAQHYFSIAVKLAAEADDPPMAGHVLRAMAHQAVDLGHCRQGLELAAASMEGKRYLMASPRERALFGVVSARALGAAGQKPAAAQALIRAEDDLAAATPGDDEPSRVFFFGEASLAHETACTLRDIGDLSGALEEFRRSARTRKATTFTRTHAVTLGYLGAVHAHLGEFDQACSTWSTALDAMDGIHSARARQTVVDMRAALSAFRRSGVPAAVELDARACSYLNTGSP
ncbi:MAG: helix-turn-helix transcriptional regulator [Pseudonocardiaceae bacterium]